ncbi:MAG TPA: DMT family transporter, partial [Thermoleophilia bacterium]|nr:DMT family transporter [Thermoleophilia bacterium]
MSRKGWLLFGSLCVIWGIPYLLIRVAVRELPPPTLVFMRTVPAALLLLPIAWRRGELRGTLRHWVWIVAFAGCEMIVPWLMLANAERTLTSSMSGLLIASVPLIGAVLYPLLGAAGERLDRRRLAGLVVGFAGVACLVGIDTAGATWLAIAEVFVTAVGYALGPLV